ncbi:MAG: hypothetical protein WDZ35_03240 [Crocinitomicaceae bacterium]
MKRLKFIIPSLTATLLLFTLSNAQDLTFSKHDIGTVELLPDSDPINLSLNGERIFISEKFESAVLNYNQYSYDANGKTTFSGKLEIPGGDFKNSFDIRDVIIFGNKQYALVQNKDKNTGKNRFLAREVSNGVVSSSETEVMSFAFDKLMNSGFNHVAVSPGNKKMAVMAELPYERKEEASLKIAVYSDGLSKDKEVSLKIPGENTKNKKLILKVADDGTVYIIKRTTLKNGEKSLTIYQLMDDSKLKEYTIDLGDPLYVTSFTHTVNSDNELIVCGIYYERTTLTVNDQKMAGVFYYTNKGKSEDIMTSFALDSPVEILETRKVLISNSTVYLVAEQYKSVSEVANPGSTIPTYNYNYTHKSNYVIGLNMDGSKKFQIELSKDFSATNNNHQFYAAFFICNGKLTAVYNDQIQKYIKNHGAGLIPVLVQIDENGLMHAPIPFEGDFASSTTILYPFFAVQDSDSQLTFLMKQGTQSKLLTVQIKN